MTGTKRFMVVGAGLCGLTTAEQLASAGHDVTLLERSPFVGGLARSIRHDDGFTFDVGPHFFFLGVRSDVSDYARRMVRGPYRELDYRISSRFRGREIAWPPNALSLFKLPPAAVLRYLRRVMRQEVPTQVDFEGVASFAYGRPLYDAFFAPYLKKKLPVVTGAELHRDWWILARRTTDNRLDTGGDPGLAQIRQQIAKR